jgi:hypothetical protein
VVLVWRGGGELSTPAWQQLSLLSQTCCNCLLVSVRLCLFLPSCFVWREREPRPQCAASRDTGTEQQQQQQPPRNQPIKARGQHKPSVC